MLTSKSATFQVHFLEFRLKTQKSGIDCAFFLFKRPEIRTKFISWNPDPKRRTQGYILHFLVQGDAKWQCAVKIFHKVLCVKDLCLDYR